MKNIKVIISIIILFSSLFSAEWHQDIHDPQRTGYVPEEPEKPWSLLWTWNGPDANGGTNGHFYHAPVQYQPWEARTVTGGDAIYAPANDSGIYALYKTNGGVKWNVTAAAFNSTPAYDPDTGFLFAGADDGNLYKINASSGGVVDTYYAGTMLRKSTMLIDGYAFTLTTNGDLHKIDCTTMTQIWVYNANSETQTLPAYSKVRDCIIFCTADLYVHAVNNNDGSQKWRVKPYTLPWDTNREFTGGWPVVAEQNGIVLVRMVIGDITDIIEGGGGPIGIWPSTMSNIRQRLIDNPKYENLFALNLDNGSKKIYTCCCSRRSRRSAQRFSLLTDP